MHLHTDIITCVGSGYNNYASLLLTSWQCFRSAEDSHFAVCLPFPPVSVFVRYPIHIPFISHPYPIQDGLERGQSVECGKNRYDAVRIRKNRYDAVGIGNGKKKCLLSNCIIARKERTISHTITRLIYPIGYSKLTFNLNNILTTVLSHAPHKKKNPHRVTHGSVRIIK